MSKWYEKWRLFQMESSFIHSAGVKQRKQDGKRDHHDDDDDGKSSKAGQHRTTIIIQIKLIHKSLTMEYNVADWLCGTNWT